MNCLKALIITGPTASGKTQLSEMIAAKIPSEIINADVGQFYKPISVGTAKPDLKNVSYAHHLFDLLDRPEDLSVIKYRELVIDLVKDICTRGKLPVIVGGSQFYIKSLFFPPLRQESLKQELLEYRKVNLIDLDKLSSQELWNLLKQVDLARAEKLHVNDIYRVKRALQIWQQTGTKPSELKPEFKAEFDALIVYVQPEPDILKKRIRQRTESMLESSTRESWLLESEKLINTDWENFLKIKGLIGYPEIFDWIRSGKKREELPALIDKIQTQTIQYAKRQKTFWKSFEREISQAPKSKFLIQTISVDLPEEKVLGKIISELNI